MIERFVGDCNVDLLSETFLDGEPVDDAVDYSGLALAACEHLFDNPNLAQAEIDQLTGEELAEQTEQAESKAEIDRLLSLNAEDRAQASRAGSYATFRDVARIKRPRVRPEGLKLSAAVSNTQQAIRNEMVLLNLGLVGSATGKRWPKEHLKHVDLFQFGVEGLIRAVEKYDQQRGCAFSTYALPWIRMKLQRGIDSEERAISWPIAIEEGLRPVTRLVEDLEHYAHQLPVSAAELYSLCEERDASTITPEQVKEYTAMRVADVSLDEIPEPAADEPGYDEVERRVFASQVMPLVKDVIDRPGTNKSEGLIFLLFGMNSTLSGQTRSARPSYAHVARELGKDRKTVRVIYQPFIGTVVQHLTDEAMAGDTTGLMV
jgi:RNA polymerase sigma factor (sigma-70 family)